MELEPGGSADVGVADAPAVTPAAPAATPAAAAPDAPTNRWTAMRESVATMGEGAHADAEHPEAGPSEQPTAAERQAAKAAKPAAPKGPAKAPTDDTPAADGTDAKGEAGKGDAKAERRQGPRFELVDGTGKKLEGEARPALELPAGTAIAFKADGKDVKVSSVAELVSMAQKGVAFDRQSGELGELRRTLTHSQAESARQLEQQTTEFEEIMVKVVTDPKVFAKMRETLKPYADPTARENARKAAALDARTAAEEAAAAAKGSTDATEAESAYWEAHRTAFDEKLDDFDALMEDDYPLVRELFEKGFNDHLAELRGKYLEPLIEKGSTPAEAEARIQQEAVKWLGTANLIATMERLNTRLRSGTGRAPDRVGQEEADRHEADRHNTHVSKKIEQRDRSRFVRGGKGGPPASGVPASEADTSDLRPGETAWDRRRANMSRTLQSARRPATD